MNRTLNFAKRNLMEISRDVLSYIFCVAFPIIMLIIMTLVNESIPKEAGMTIFRIDNLAGGIIIFGQTFVMLFMALTIAKDRSGSFLIRLFATPMKSSNFTNGYILPMILVAVVQALISLVAAMIISLIVGVKISILGMLLVLVVMLPSALMFIAIGLVFGTLFNEKAAPGLCSIIISLGSFVGGIWFDAEGAGGVLYKICRCLPFIYCTKSVRSAIRLDLTWEGFVLPLIIVTASAAVLSILSIMCFRTRMKADLA
jgi:ABC-type bacteriocin/lantibiotic exporters, contain an N-terminal double-glycine peptidase domain